MTKIKVEKILVISFIGFIIPFFVIVGGNPPLRAGLPTSDTKAEINFEKDLQLIEDDLLAGTITRFEYDSLTSVIRQQIRSSEALTEENHSITEIPEWVAKLGINEPKGMKLDVDFSSYTSVDDPTEGFNSVSLIYTGEYENAVKEANRIALNAQLKPGRNFKSIGSPENSKIIGSSKALSFLNYSLGVTNQDFLISVQVEPSGKLIIDVTDNKQLNKCLLTYEPLNNRQNSSAKQKKQ